MLDLIFITVSLIYFFSFYKIEHWHTIYRLGFKEETPRLFLTNRKYYRIFSTSLFAILVILSLNSIYIKWWLALLICVALYFISSILGRRSALKLYRSILQEMINDKNISEENKSDLRERLKLDDLTILKRYTIFE